MPRRTSLVLASFRQRRLEPGELRGKLRSRLLDTPLQSAKPPSSALARARLPSVPDGSRRLVEVDLRQLKAVVSLQKFEAVVRSCSTKTPQLLNGELSIELPGHVATWGCYRCPSAESRPSGRRGPTRAGHSLVAGVQSGEEPHRRQGTSFSAPTLVRTQLYNETDCSAATLYACANSGTGTVKTFPSRSLAAPRKKALAAAALRARQRLRVQRLRRNCRDRRVIVRLAVWS